MQGGWEINRISRRVRTIPDSRFVRYFPFAAIRARITIGKRKETGGRGVFHAATSPDFSTPAYALMEY